jgi:hypothetical protein
MKLQNIAKYVGFALLVVISFSLGYFYGTRDKYDKKPDNLDLIGPNLSIQNSLSQLQTKDILGFTQNNEVKTYGQFYYKVLNDKSTEVMFSLSDIPNSLKQANLKGEKSIPNELNIDLARISLDGLDYNFENIGKITFDEPKNGLRSGRFPTIVKPFQIGKDSIVGISNVKQIIFRPIKPEDANIFKINNSDIPIKQRDQPAGYFWVNL